MVPVRIQLSRKKGFNLQATSKALNGLEAVKVDRTTKWGNPFIVGTHGTRTECVNYYEILLSGLIRLGSGNAEHQQAALVYAQNNVRKLRGKNLACWCRGAPCHADVLLALANRTSP